jgi:hypothetical protein
MKLITKAAVVAMAEPKEWLRITPDDRLRFAIQLEISGSHMRWTGGRNGTYGQFKFRSACKAHRQYTVGAHIFAYFNAHSMYLPSPGELKGLDVGHTCTDHLCCEPLHLYLGTHDANMEERRYRVPELNEELEAITI